MSALFGLSEKALAVTEERATLLSANLVNSATPQYKAKDIDFNQIMKTAEKSTTLHATHANHIHKGDGLEGQLPIQYRIPMQTSLDGNTVDPEIERKNFLDNSIKYQVSLNFIQNKTDQLRKAIRGE